MIELGAATEDEMILAFVRAEIDSSRYAQYFRGLLALKAADRTLIDNPDLGSNRENAIRKDLLGAIRGYGKDQYLFAGFPLDVLWRRVTLQPGDFETMRYAKHDTWTTISKGTRLVSVGARTLSETGHDRHTEQVTAIANALRNGARFAELIAAADADRGLILIEGHSRATAYTQVGVMDEVPCIVGSSQSMPKWAFY